VPSGRALRGPVGANPESRCNGVVSQLWIPGSRLKKARPGMMMMR